MIFLGLRGLFRARLRGVTVVSLSHSLFANIVLKNFLHLHDWERTVYTSSTTAANANTYACLCLCFHYRFCQNSALLSPPIIEQVSRPCLRHCCAKAKCYLALKLSQFVLWTSLHWILRLTQFRSKYGFYPFLIGAPQFVHPCVYMYFLRLHPRKYINTQMYKSPVSCHSH